MFNYLRVGGSEENSIFLKQQLEEGERRIRELEELIKRSPFGNLTFFYLDAPVFVHCYVKLL